MTSLLFSHPSPAQPIASLLLHLHYLNPQHCHPLTLPAHLTMEKGMNLT